MRNIRGHENALQDLVIAIARAVMVVLLGTKRDELGQEHVPGIRHAMDRCALLRH